jgi:hypothetical protein
MNNAPSAAKMPAAGTQALLSIRPGGQRLADVLDEPSLLGDGCGEEEGVQRGAVESFPGVRAGRHAASRGGPPGCG